MCQLFMLALFQTRFQTRGEAWGKLYRRKISEEKERAADFCIVFRAARALRNMSVHADELDAGKRIVYER